MLKKVVTLKNVGLLRNGTPQPATFERVTLVYGENGRGKSTVATVLRAASAHDSESVALTRTIDSDEDPNLELIFVDAQGSGRPVSHKRGAWVGARPNVYVFDPGFVESNVFSGQAVRPDQRQSLLQFALGEESVALEKELVGVAQTITETTKRVTDATKRVSAFAGQMSVKEFVRLADVPDAEAQIEKLRSRIEAAKNSASLLQRPMPEHLPQVELDIGAYFSILRSSLTGVRENARRTVQDHFQKHSRPAGIEAWVTQGRTFATEGDCPFCGQDLGKADLIEAYDAYFNQAYNQLMDKVGVLAKGVEARLSDSRIDLLAPRIDANEARIAAWADQMAVQIPKFDLDLARSSVATLRELAADLARRKQQQPLEPVGADADVAAATNLLRQVRLQIDMYNEAVTAAAQGIRRYTTELQAESPGALASAIARLEAVISRRSERAQEAIADLAAAEAKKDGLTQRKAELRKSLDALLPNMLSQYQGRINALLRKFGAGFEIVHLKPDHTGGKPRSDYALQVRGRSINLMSRSGAGSPSFGTMLSEGDKRTLALAFFLAKLQALQDLELTTVVFDDPMCSFDKKRRSNTIDSILEIISRGAQVVVLSHDPDFLNDLRKKLDRAPFGITPAVHEIRRVQEDYSAFAPCDLEQICESDYHRGHRLVREYVEGVGTSDRRFLVRELRPLMEGFLKQRFPPPLLPARANLGQIVKIISAAETAPLVHAKKYVRKLDAINQFDTKYHHNDGDDLGIPDDGELRRFAQMTLEVIYGDYGADE